MKILLIGGSGSLINTLIVRLNKEGQRVSLLTGSEFRDEKYGRVFERYNFLYNTEQISDIFESVDPDVTVFTGAFDTVYDWRRQEDRVSVRYISDLLNLLTGFLARRRGRFVYLSSEDVFDGGKVYTEEDRPDSTDSRGMALAQAEAMCENCRKDRGADIVTLRLGGLYHMPERLSDIDEPVTQMCLAALERGKIHYRDGYEVAPLSERDAVQFILQVIFADTCASGLYNIAADRVLRERELADIVAQQFAGQPEQISSSRKRAILSNARFKSAFGMNRFAVLEKDIRRICAYMEEHPEIFLLDKEKKKSLWERLTQAAGSLSRALVPIAENLIVFIPVLFLSGQAAGSRFFSRIDFYLLYVLLFAVVHGQQQAILSALLSTCGYIWEQTGSRSGLDVMVDYNTYVWIAQLFIVGLVVGYMRDQIDKLKGEAREDHVYMSRRVTDIQDINESNVRVKDALETQVISQHDSVGKVYEIVSRLNRYSGDEVLFYAARVIQELMYTKDVAIYTNIRGPYARLFTATSKRARSLGNSIRYREMGKLYDDLKEHKVFINRTLDKDLPMMACAIYEQEEGAEERIGTIVMVWGLSWERTTLSEANLLAVICALIRDAVYRAAQYLKAIEESRYVRGTSVMNPEAFRRLIRSHMEAQQKGLTQAVFVHVCGDGSDLQSLSEAVRSTVRETDYLGTLDDGELYILLTNTDEAGAEVAMQRMKAKGIRAQKAQIPDLSEETKGKHSLAGGIKR